MMCIGDLIELLYNQAIDGEFANTSKTLKVIDKLTTEQKELIVAAYWIGFNLKPSEEEAE